jgi:hypothetical protein
VSAEVNITEERLALIATQGVSAQLWEMRMIAAECLAHRIATKTTGSRKPPIPQPVDPSAAKAGTES